MNTEQQQDFQIALQAYLEHIKEFCVDAHQSVFVRENTHSYMLYLQSSQGNTCNLGVMPYNYSKSGIFLGSIDKYTGNVTNSSSVYLLGNILQQMPLDIKPLVTASELSSIHLQS